MDINAGRQTKWCSHQEPSFRNQSIYLFFPFPFTSWGSKQLDFDNAIFKPLTKQVNCGLSDMLLGEQGVLFYCFPLLFPAMLSSGIANPAAGFRSSLGFQRERFPPTGFFQE